MAEKVFTLYRGGDGERIPRNLKGVPLGVQVVDVEQEGDYVEILQSAVQHPQHKNPSLQKLTGFIEAVDTTRVNKKITDIREKGFGKNVLPFRK